MIHDNDSMAAHLAVEVEADLLIMMTNVPGVYTSPPDQEDSFLISTYSPKRDENVKFGQKSFVGRGGMESKVSSAIWVLDRGISAVICNGSEPNAITKIIKGNNIGTFFTDSPQENVSVKQLAVLGNLL